MGITADPNDPRLKRGPDPADSGAAVEGQHVSDQGSRTFAALNVLAKWRVLFAGWQLGTRPKGDPECDAVSDHREATLLLRAEVSALVGLLMRKGVIAAEEFDDALHAEAVRLSADLERRFPGVKASETGLQMDERVLPWMKGWKP